MIQIISSPRWAPVRRKTLRVCNREILGIALQLDAAIAPEPFYASLFDKKDFLPDPVTGHTKFEQLVIASVDGALQNSGVDIRDKKTVLIISSTKGNIGLLETEATEPWSAGSNRVVYIGENSGGITSLIPINPLLFQMPVFPVRWRF